MDTISGYKSRFFFVWVSEFTIIFLSAIAAASVRLYFDNGNIQYYDPYFAKTLVLTLTYVIYFYYFDLYTPEMYRPSRAMFTKLMSASVLATVTLLTIFYMVPSLKTWRGILLIDTLMLPPMILLWRLLFSRVKSLNLPSKRVLIIGSGDLAKKIGGAIHRQSEYGLKLAGFIDDDPAKLGVSIVNPGVVGGYGDINRVVASDKISMIIVALPDRRSKLPMSALLDCKLKGISVIEGETFNERLTGNIPLDHLKPSWMVFSDGFQSLRSRKTVKRVFDIVFAVFCLIFSAPLMLLTAALVKLESRGPVIFSQTRVGEHGKDFEIYKFRSMRADAEVKTGPVWANATDNPATRVARGIRNNDLYIHTHPEFKDGYIARHNAIIRANPDEPRNEKRWEIVKNFGTIIYNPIYDKQKQVGPPDW